MRIFAHIAVAAALVTCSVALYLNRRLWPFTALNLSTVRHRRRRGSYRALLLLLPCHETWGMFTPVTFFVHEVGVLLTVGQKIGC